MIEAGHVIRFYKISVDAGPKVTHDLYVRADTRREAELGSSI